MLTPDEIRENWFRDHGNAQSPFPAREKTKLPTPDPQLMLKCLLALDGMCSGFPDNPLSDLNHPLHKFLADMYAIAHMGSQSCRGCQSGTPQQIEILERTIQDLKSANICDVEQKIQEVQNG